MSVLQKAPDFGDYVKIEQKRYGAENEMYLYKVIGNLCSNTYVPVPVDGAKGGEIEVNHSDVVPVVACICCGVMERNVRRFRISDVSLAKSAPGSMNGSEKG